VGGYNLCGAEIARAASLIQKEHEFQRATIERKWERVSAIAVKSVDKESRSFRLAGQQMRVHFPTNVVFLA
jgi:hypothetical protein